jgi:hypothetical protein
MQANRPLAIGIALIAVAASVGAFWLDWRAALLMALAGTLDRISMRNIRPKDNPLTDSRGSETPKAGITPSQHKRT